MNSLNKGAAKGQVAWRWFEVNPVPLQEGLFQLMQWIMLQLWKMMQSNICAGAGFIPVLVVKILNKGPAKGQVAWWWFKLTLHQFRKAYFYFCNGSSCNFDIVLEQSFFTCFGGENAE